MPVLTLETNKLTNTRFELIQVESIDYHNESEIRSEIDAPDRMIASMVNLGQACRWFHDRQGAGTVRIIALQRDTANKGEMLGAEHNDLYNAVSNLHNHLYGNIYQYRQDRLKYQAFYGDYVKYLDKIIDYLVRWKIAVKLVDYKEDLIRAYADT